VHPCGAMALAAPGNPLVRLMNALLFLPSREILQTPASPYEDVAIGGLHGWWVPATTPTIGQVLLFHGNAGNLGDRVPHIALLTAAGFDVLAFDYRGYGRSAGRPSEHGTYEDARAARDALGPGRTIYLGESLGGAIALELAIHHPPAGLVLQSTFTSIKAMARLHYPFIPRALVPDAYPSLRLIQELRAPLLILHGSRDAIVPLMDGEELYRAAREPKRIEVLDAGHNDMVGPRWIEAIAEWAQVSAATSR
jgi:pimeloyl-ACP methyl ester carboxylesterase